MHIDTLKVKLTSMIGKTFLFNKKVEDLEDYAESGMKARLTGFHFDGEDVAVLSFDFETFKDYNASFESRNYYDKNGKPTLNAHEAGFYKPVQDMYFPCDLQEILSYMNVLVNDKKDALVEQFQNANTDEGYVEWLENRLLEALEQGFDVTSGNEASSNMKM